MTRAFLLVVLGLLVLAPLACRRGESGDDCENGRDDDENGLVDCNDPGCILDERCGSCGDSVIDDHETCDDGNRDNGDGCSDRCLSERCGNGIVDDGEECDDGDIVPGDGCSARCEVDRCGDRVLQVDLEQCEDGNRQGGDGCSADCRAEPNPTCGDGFTFDPETGQRTDECDDGNRQSGDGCSAACRFEFCGDSVVQPGLGERCDDGDVNRPDNCFGCRVVVCGDGRVEFTEQCDDGNDTGGDGCSATCQLE